VPGCCPQKIISAPSRRVNCGAHRIPLDQIHASAISKNFASCPVPIELHATTALILFPFFSTSIYRCINTHFRLHCNAFCFLTLCLLFLLLNCLYIISENARSCRQTEGQSLRCPEQDCLSTIISSMALSIILQIGTRAAPTNCSRCSVSGPSTEAEEELERWQKHPFSTDTSHGSRWAPRRYPVGGLEQCGIYHASSKLW
jgi:hypothetical protein